MQLQNVPFSVPAWQHLKGYPVFQTVSLSKSYPTIFATFQNRRRNNQKLACYADVEKQLAR